MSRRFVFCLPVSLMVCALATSSAPAASMNWGDFVGDTVIFFDVTETNGEPALLFSMPSIAGDTLEVDPVNFFSEVDPGPGSDVTDSTLTTVVKALPGNRIDNLMVSEAGDFTLIGAPGSLATASVAAAFFFEVLEVDGVPVGDGPSGTINMVFSTGGGPNGGEYSLPGDGGTTVPWEGTAFIDVAAAMAASQYAGQNATLVSLSFDNTLSTTADANSSAFIKKKLIGGLTIETNIPEPSTIAVALLCGLPLGMVALRRRRAAC